MINSEKELPFYIVSNLEVIEKLIEAPRGKTKVNELATHVQVSADTLLSAAQRGEANLFFQRQDFLKMTS